MLNFLLSSESTCDLTKTQIEKYNVNIINVHAMVDGVEYLPNQLTTMQLCEKMRNGASTKTFQVNEYELKEYFERLLSLGKDILHFSFSSAQSGTCNNAQQVAKQLNEQNKNKIYVVDTLCQSAGVGLLISIVHDKIVKDDLTIEQAYRYAECIKLNIDHCFIVDNLKYLAKGGRIKTSTAILGNMLILKPMLHLDDKGYITNLQKIMGRKRSITALIDKILANYNGMSKRIIVTHSDCLQEANQVVDSLKKALPSCEIWLNDLGCVITSHCGPGVISVYFTTNERN